MVDLSEISQMLGRVQLCDDLPASSCADGVAADSFTYWFSFVSTVVRRLAAELTHLQFSESQYVRKDDTGYARDLMLKRSPTVGFFVV